MRRHEQLDGSGGVHLLADDLDDLLQHPQPQRHIGISPGAQLADHARPEQQDVAGSHGIGRCFLERRNQSMRPAHLCKPPGTIRLARSRPRLRSGRCASMGKNANVPHPRARERARNDSRVCRSQSNPMRRFWFCAVRIAQHRVHQKGPSARARRLLPFRPPVPKRQF